MGSAVDVMTTRPRGRDVISGALVAALLVTAACSAGGERGSEAHPAAAAPVDWLLRGGGAEALRALPGASWPPERPLQVAADCGPTDALEGWSLSATVVPADDRTPDFDGAPTFERGPDDRRGVWTHEGETRLQLIEQDDGRVDARLFVPAAEAPDWDTADEATLEVVFDGARCG